MSFGDYFVIYAISQNDFRIVTDKETQAIQFYSTHEAAKKVKEKLQRKNPLVKYHIRTFNMEEKFLKEYEQ